MKLLAIDPGNTESAYVVLDENYKPLEFKKIDNVEFRDTLCDIINQHKIRDVTIEMVAHYGTGMPAGKEIFDTCVWIGRFENTLMRHVDVKEVTFIYRKQVVTNLCGSARAKDSNVIQALIDRFAYGVPNKGKGIVNKKVNKPGWFYGFAEDIWQAYAVGVTYFDLHKLN